MGRIEWTVRNWQVNLGRRLGPKQFQLGGGRSFQRIEIHDPRCQILYARGLPPGNLPDFVNQGAALLFQNDGESTFLGIGPNTAGLIRTPQVEVHIFNGTTEIFCPAPPKEITLGPEIRQCHLRTSMGRFNFVVDGGRKKEVACTLT